MTEARAETMVKVVFVVFINRTLLKIILQKLYSFQSCLTRKRRRCLGIGEKKKEGKTLL